MATPDPDADPGWLPAWGSLIHRWWEFDHEADRHPLVVCRGTWIRLVLATFVFGSAAAVAIGRHEGPPDPGLVASLIVGSVSIVSVLALPRLVPLDARTSETLRQSYRSRFRWRMAVATTPALIGFLASGLVGPTWVFFIGEVFTLAGLISVMPTSRSVEADQRALSSAGSALSLRTALRRSALPA